MSISIHGACFRPCHVWCFNVDPCSQHLQGIKVHTPDQSTNTCLFTLDSIRYMHHNRDRVTGALVAVHSDMFAISQPFDGLDSGQNMQFAAFDESAGFSLAKPHHRRLTSICLHALCRGKYITCPGHASAAARQYQPDNRSRKVAAPRQLSRRHHACPASSRAPLFQCTPLSAALGAIGTQAFPCERCVMLPSSKMHDHLLRRASWHESYRLYAASAVDAQCMDLPVGIIPGLWLCWGLSAAFWIMPCHVCPQKIIHKLQLPSRVSLGQPSLRVCLSIVMLQGGMQRAGPHVARIELLLQQQALAACMNRRLGSP